MSDDAHKIRQYIDLARNNPEHPYNNKMADPVAHERAVAELGSFYDALALAEEQTRPS
jgi:hypothetical protein